MVVSYSLIHPGVVVFDETRIGIVYKCSCKKFNGDLYGIMSGIISKEIINYKVPLRNSRKPNEPRPQLGKYEIPHLLQNLTVEISAYKEYIPKAKEKEKVELVIGNIEMTLSIKMLYINFIDKIQGYYLEDFEFKAKIQEEKPA